MIYPRCSLLVAAFFFILTQPVQAKISWIDLPLAGGGTVKALLGVPEGTEKFPAVIYSHGMIVRRIGYDVAASNGYDVKDYVEALNKAGYIALAPIRDMARLANPHDFRGKIDKMSNEEFAGGVRQGIAAIEAGATFLADHPRRTGKLGIMGFSEGGLATLWAAIREVDASAVILMSPATIRQAGKYSMKPATRPTRLKKIKGEVMITMGRNDGRSILKVVPKRLVPSFKKAGKTILVKSDYPGDHKWFYRVREEPWADITAFFARHLK